MLTKLCKSEVNSDHQYCTVSPLCRNKILTSVIVFVWMHFSFITGFTQVPNITSFTPTSGPIGTTVTITGSNFDATPANNFVLFGATQATVTAATVTTLTVTVPTGVTYQPITILTNGLIAWSSSPFVVTFTGGGTIDANSFSPKVDYKTGSNPP